MWGGQNNWRPEQLAMAGTAQGAHTQQPIMQHPLPFDGRAAPPGAPPNAAAALFQNWVAHSNPPQGFNFGAGVGIPPAAAMALAVFAGGAGPGFPAPPPANFPLPGPPPQYPALPGRAAPPVTALELPITSCGSAGYPAPAALLQPPFTSLPLPPSIPSLAVRSNSLASFGTGQQRGEDVSMTCNSCDSPRAAAGLAGSRSQVLLGAQAAPRSGASDAVTGVDQDQALPDAGKAVQQRLHYVGANSLATSQQPSLEGVGVQQQAPAPADSSMPSTGMLLPGTPQFAAVRAMMLKQQSTFVQQLLELHKLVQVQKLLWHELDYLNPAFSAMANAQQQQQAARQARIAEQQQQHGAGANGAAAGGPWAGAGSPARAGSAPIPPPQAAAGRPLTAPTTEHALKRSRASTTSEAAQAALDHARAQGAPQGSALYYGHNPGGPVDASGGAMTCHGQGLGSSSLDQQQKQEQRQKLQRQHSGIGMQGQNLDGSGAGGGGNGKQVLAAMRVLANIPSSLRNALNQAVTGSQGPDAPDTAAAVADLQARVRRAAQSGSVVKPAASKLYTFDDGGDLGGGPSRGRARPTISAQVTVTQPVPKAKPKEVPAAPPPAPAAAPPPPAGPSTAVAAGPSAPQQNTGRQQQDEKEANAAAAAAAGNKSAFQQVVPVPGPMPLPASPGPGPSGAHGAHSPKAMPDAVMGMQGDAQAATAAGALAAAAARGAAAMGESLAAHPSLFLPPSFLPPAASAGPAGMPAMFHHPPAVPMPRPPAGWQLGPDVTRPVASLPMPLPMPLPMSLPLAAPQAGGLQLPALFAIRQPVPGNGEAIAAGAAIRPPPLMQLPAPQPLDLHSAWFAKHIEGRLDKPSAVPTPSAAAVPAATPEGLPPQPAPHEAGPVQGTAAAGTAQGQGQAGRCEPPAAQPPAPAQQAQQLMQEAGAAAAAAAVGTTPAAGDGVGTSKGASVVRWWQDANATFGKLGLVDPQVIGTSVAVATMPDSHEHERDMHDGRWLTQAEWDRELMPAPHMQAILPLKKRTKFGGEHGSQYSGGPSMSGSASGAGSAATGNTTRSGQPDNFHPAPKGQPGRMQHQPSGARGMPGAGSAGGGGVAPVMGPSAFKPVVPHKARSKRGSNRMTINTHASGATGDTSGSWGSGDSASSQGHSGGGGGGGGAKAKRGQGQGQGGTSAAARGRVLPARRSSDLDGASAQVSGVAGAVGGIPAVHSGPGPNTQVSRGMEGPEGPEEEG